MNKNQPIVIEPVANGWIVRPEIKEGLTINASQMEVFQTMEGRYGLLEFIASHFTPFPPPENDNHSQTGFDKQSPRQSRQSTRRGQ